MIRSWSCWKVQIAPYANMPTANIQNHKNHFRSHQFCMILRKRTAIKSKWFFISFWQNSFVLLKQFVIMGEKLSDDLLSYNDTSPIHYIQCIILARESLFRRHFVARIHIVYALCSVLYVYGSRFNIVVLSQLQLFSNCYSTN